MSAKSWESFDPADDNSWDEYEPDAAPIEKEQPPVGGLQLLQNSGESLWNAVKDVPSSFMDMQQNLAAGAIRVPTEVVGAGIELGEGLTNNAINSYNQLTGQPLREDNSTVSDFVKGTGRQSAEMLRPEDQGLGGRVLEEIGTYALPSAGVTKMMISSGQLLANAPRTLGMFENMLVQASKDPRMAMALDQTISAMMASAGQLSEEAGLSPMQRALIELTTGVTTGLAIPGVINKSKQLLQLTKDGTKTLSRHAAGNYLNDIAAEDPMFMRTLEKNLKVSKRHGVDMDLPELTRNPELKAAKESLIEDAAGGATRELKTLESQTSQVKQAFDFDPKLVDDAVNKVNNDITKIESALQKQIDSAENLAIKEAVPFKQSSLKDAGESALVRLDEAETLATNKLSKMYGKIGFDVPVKTDVIRDAIRQAKKSDLPGNQWRGELPAHLKSVTDNLINKDNPIEELTLKGVQELQGLLKSEIRSSRAAGNDQLVRELSKVLDSTYIQLDGVTGLSRESVKLLKSANSQARINHTRFDDSRVSMLNKVDGQGIIKTAPEDVIKNIIKPNSQKNSTQAVIAYQNAVGNPAKSKEVLKQGFVAKLAAHALNKPALKNSESILSPKATDNFLKQHSNFLKSSGLDSEFKNPAQAAKAMEASQEVLQATVNKLARSELSKWVKSDNVVKYISSAIKSGKINKLLLEAKGDPIKLRGIYEAVWEGVLKDANLTRGIQGFEKNMTVETLREVIQKDHASLRAGLGEIHYKHTKDLMRIVDSITIKPTKTAGFVTEKPIGDLTEKLLTGLRAAAHGFVRPDLIVAQAGKRSIEAKLLKESKKLVAEALVNPRFAKGLMRTHRSGLRGRRLVEATLAPFAGSAVDTSTDK